MVSATNITLMLLESLCSCFRIIITTLIIQTFKNIGSFIEPESNVNLQPKRGNVTEKKTPLATSMNKKTMFTRILSRQEANEDLK